MTQIVQVPGVGPVQFPDGMSDADISAAIRRTLSADPTEGMSGMDKFLAGTGKALTDLARGAAQLVGKGPTPEEMADIKNQDAALMNTGAGVAGNIAGNVAATLPTMMIPGVNTYTGATALGATMGLLQPVATGESRTINTLVGAGGGAAGQAVGNLFGRAIRPVSGSLTSEAERLAQVAASEGIPLDAAARTGSKPLKTINAVFENLPFTAGPQAAQNEARQSAFNAAVLKRAGVNASEATPDILASQKKNIGSTFEAIAGRNALDFNKGLAYDISNIADTASRRLPNAGKSITNTVQDILAEAPQGVMAGTKYQGWRSELGRLARGNDSEAHYFGEIKKALDKAFNSQISGGDAAAWNQASREYANLKTIMGAMGGPGNAAASGDIAATQLAAALRQSIGKEGNALGRGDLNDLARIGNLFVRDQVPNSGTAQRALYQALLTGGGTGIGAGAAAATGQDPLQGAMYGAAGMGSTLVAPRLAQALIQSAPAQNYMVRQAGDPVARALALAVQNAGRSVGATVPAIYGSQ